MGWYGVRIHVPIPSHTIILGCSCDWKDACPKMLKWTRVFLIFVANYCEERVSSFFLWSRVIYLVWNSLNNILVIEQLYVFWVNEPKVTFFWFNSLATQNRYHFSGAIFKPSDWFKNKIIYKTWYCFGLLSIFLYHHYGKRVLGICVDSSLF